MTASTRRQFLIGGAAAGLGLGLGAATTLGVQAATGSGAVTDAAAADPLHGDDTVPFHGPHQAGIDTPAQAHALFVALDLRDDVDRGGLARLMRLLTDDAARLTRGEPALADTEPELALVPARLTVTFGFGAGLVARAAPAAAPTWLRPLPAFSIDRLDPAFSGGDLMLQVAADDPVTVAHAARMLLKDARAFATVRWTQRGFRRSVGAERPGTTMRNLFGQVDGTANPVPGTKDFDRVVWIAGGPLAGGTSLVLRRVHMDLDGWDRVDRFAREQSVGRTLDTGAPLTGTHEDDEPDLEATNAMGLRVIPEFAHLRRSRTGDPEERIFRRGYNYDDPPTGDAISDAGLLFASFQADVDRQFVPIQRRLAELDLLNEWTTPVGSAVFAVPPGCAEGGFVGETLLA